jgi:hypothetical protein
MPFEHSPGSGALFKNRHKKNPKAPNLVGSAVLEMEDGSRVDVEIAAWTRESPKAGKWLSLAVELKRDRQNGDRPTQKRLQDDSDIDRAFSAQPQRRAKCAGPQEWNSD